MRRLLLLLTVSGSLLAPALVSGSVTESAAARPPVLLAFRGFHFGGGGFGRSRSYYGYGGRRYGLFGSRRGHGFLHNLVRWLAISYLLHLFFAHGGLSILLWLVIIGLVLHFARRRRRRASFYA